MTLSIRSATPGDAPAIAAARIDAWRTTYRGMIPDAYLDGMTVDASTALWDRVLNAPADKAAVAVAEHDGEVIGFAAANLLDPPKHGADAELAAIYLRASYRRAGLGRRLVGEVVEGMRRRGAHALVVWVIAANKPARAFYEALGGELIVEQPFVWDGMDLVEAGYRFPDLAALAAACAAPPQPNVNLQ